LDWGLLEASAVGVPVIGSDVGGLVECICQNRAGLVVPPRDPEALSQAISTLAEDVLLRKKMTREGQMFMLDEFRREAMVEKTVAVYRKLLAADRYRMEG
jgi:glycosyltransferase involved in cell wall biosynthesis